MIKLKGIFPDNRPKYDENRGKQIQSDECFCQVCNKTHSITRLNKNKNLWICSSCSKKMKLDFNDETEFWIE